MTNPSAEFEKLHKTLRSQHSNIVNRALKLQNDVVSPATTDPEQVWSIFWDKPLWAARKFEPIEKLVEEIGPETVGLWREWGQKVGTYQLCKSTEGRDKHVFLLDGEKTELHPSISALRHYSIYGAARYLWRAQQREDRSQISPAFQPANLFKEAPRQKRKKIIKDLQISLGTGWGCITILHLLTDFGVAAKPDRHVIRSLSHFDDGFSTNPTSAARAVDVWARVEKLLQTVNEGRPEEKRLSLRYFEKILMAFSEQHLL
ncbi:MAG: hypothetical protein ACE360_02465 [Hyphomicrobiales bacterium]